MKDFLLNTLALFIIIPFCLFFIWLFWNCLAGPLNRPYVTLRKSLKYSGVLLAVVGCIGVVVGLVSVFPLFCASVLFFGCLSLMFRCQCRN